MQNSMSTQQNTMRGENAPLSSLDDDDSPSPNMLVVGGITETAEDMVKGGLYTREAFDALMVLVRIASDGDELLVERIEDELIVLLPDHPPPDHDALGAIILEAQGMARAGHYMYTDYEDLMARVRVACGRHRDVLAEMDDRLRKLLPGGGR